MFSVFVPILFMVGLTVTVEVFLVLRRKEEADKDATLLERSATDNTQYAERSRKVANNFTNLLELPTLFYVACILALLVGATGWWTGVLTWTFVLSRVLHTVIHTTINVVMARFAAYAVGLAALILLWLNVVIEAPGSAVFEIGAQEDLIEDRLEELEDLQDAFRAPVRP